MKYRAEIDGLRAVAVAPVILFHAGLEAFGGGYVGVDVFFVISGYLITSLILAERAKGGFSLTDFYARRVRRILPALFLVMAACLVLAWAWMLPSEIAAFSRTLAANAVFASNILFWKRSGYFEPNAEETPLLHTWSLAVEEQFYVLFPLAVMAFWRLGTVRLGWLFAAAAAASLALAEWGWRVHPDGAFYLAPTRAWELLAGALCALHETRRGTQRSNVLSLLGLALIAVAVFAYDKSTPFPSLFTLAPVLGAALVVAFAAEGTLAARLLSSRPFVALGLVSYSAYLWHFPMFAFARIRNHYEPSGAMMAGLIALTLVLAWSTWRFVELPFRRARLSQVNKARLFAGALAGVAAFGALGLFGASPGRAESVWLIGKDERTQQLQELLRNTPAFTPEGLIDDGDCHFNAQGLSDEAIERFEDCVDRHGPGVVILGDSHAINLYQAIAQNTDYPVVFGLTSGGCRPHAPRPECQYEAFADYARAQPERIKRVIFTQAGYYLLQDAKGNPGRWDFFDRSTLPLYRMKPETALAVYDYLARLARSVDVVWLGPRLEPRFDIRRILETGCEPGSITLRPNIREIFTRLDEDLKALVAARASGTRLTYVSHLDIVKFDPARDIGNCQRLYWADPNHWSREGEKYFGARLVGPLLD